MRLNAMSYLNVICESNCGCLLFFKAAFLDSPTDFTVDARAVSKRSDAKVTCNITNPSGTKTDSLVQPQNDGTYRVSYTPFEEGIVTDISIYSFIIYYNACIRMVDDCVVVPLRNDR